MSKRSLATLLTVFMGLLASAVPALADINATPIGNHDGFEGEVGVLSCASVGWAVDPDDRVADLSIRIFADGVEVANGVADVFRQDLIDAGVSPDGFSGWFIPLWDVLTFDEPHTINAQARDAQTLEWVDIGAPKQLTCLGDNKPGWFTGTVVDDGVPYFDACDDINGTATLTNDFRIRAFTTESGTFLQAALTIYVVTDQGHTGVSHVIIQQHHPDDIVRTNAVLVNEDGERLKLEELTLRITNNGGELLVDTATGLTSTCIRDA